MFIADGAATRWVQTEAKHGSAHSKVVDHVVRHGVACSRCNQLVQIWAIAYALLNFDVVGKVAQILNTDPQLFQPGARSPSRRQARCRSFEQTAHGQNVQDLFDRQPPYDERPASLAPQQALTFKPVA